MFKRVINAARLELKFMRGNNSKIKTIVAYNIFYKIQLFATEWNLEIFQNKPNKYTHYTFLCI